MAFRLANNIDSSLNLWSHIGGADSHLSRAPLMKFGLLRTSNEECPFVWSFHHALLDGWSAYLVLKEVLAFYEALCEGDELSLSVPRPYSDYVAWLKVQDLQAAETFWTLNLEGFGSPTPLPLQHQRNSAKVNQETEVMWLSRPLSRQFRQLGARNRVTPSTAIYGLWGLVLSRYSDEKEVVFGTTISGRADNLPGVESMGFSINTIPIRVSVYSDNRLCDWLENLQLDLAIAQQQYGYVSLVDAKEPSQVSPMYLCLKSGSY